MRPSGSRSGLPSYAIVRIRNDDGSISFCAVPKEAVKQASKELYEDYLRAAREWQRDGEQSARPAPQKPELRVMESLTGPDAKRLAEARANNYQNRYDSSTNKQHEPEGEAVDASGEEPKAAPQEPKPAAPEPVAQPAK